MESHGDIVLKDLDSVKKKLNSLLCSEQYCGICYETGKCFNLFSERLRIIANDWTQDMLIRDVYNYVFQKDIDLPTSEHICSECTEQLKHSYIFTRNSNLFTKILETYIHDLDSKSMDLITHFETNKAETTNIVIVLENNYVNKIMSKRETKLYQIILPKKVPKMEKSSISFKCLECSKELPSLQLWRLHTSEYHKQTFKCILCSKTFKSQQYLIAHYKIHSKVICKICHLIVSDRKLKDHLREKHEDVVFLCNICTDTFYTLDGLATHAKLVHAIKQESSQCQICLLNTNDKHNCVLKCSECNEKPCIHNKYLTSYREQVLNHVCKVKCLDCSYICRKKEQMIGHVNREHLNHHPYICNKCGQQFYSKNVLKTHIQELHKDQITCKYCDTDFKNSELLKDHEFNCKLIKRDATCLRCPASFDTSNKLEKHIKLRHREIFPCGLCNKKFFKGSKRKEHMVKAHSGVQTKHLQPQFECAICQERHDTKGDLIRHMKRHGPDAKFPCRICNTEYESLRKFRAHNRKHIGPFAICKICGKEMRKVLLQKHLHNHNFDGIVSCDTCGKSFQNLTLLKYHQKSHLNNVKCPECDKMINPAKLRRHIKGHRMEENPSLKENKQKANIKCELCDYITWNNILLECHMNRHHLKVKPYVCHICSKDFVGKHLLKKHIASHTLDKSVSCMVCGKTFANSTCLKLHLRLHTGEKNYPCDVCGEKFRSSSIMNVHKRKKHAEKDKCCPLCSSKFFTLGELRRHVVKVHWKDKDRKFDPRELKGLENHYHLFHDGRRIKIDEEDVDFYMPC